MAKNINNKPFDETTQLKLEIFRECFREWFPVFLHNQWADEVMIFDFFAGSGKDTDGNYGSPLVLLDEAKGENRKFCKQFKKPIGFSFNESLKGKSVELNQNATEHIKNCEKENACGGCIYTQSISQAEFKDVFQSAETKAILQNRKIGKFILLDQYGFSQIDDDIFQKLISYPITDFIFFISSSFIKRFQEHPSVKAYIDTEKIDFNQSSPKECHRIIAEYFRNSIPSEKEYYLHHFSIQKETGKGNYYGLIFGSNHTLGMEKFLKVCWQKDTLSGEANFNINNDFEPGELFFTGKTSNKKQTVEADLEDKILNKVIGDNITGLKYTLQQGCEPNVFTDVVKRLEKRGRVNRTGNLNYGSANIHKIKTYYIHVN